MIEYIDIDAVLRNRLPKYYKFLPRFVVRLLERVVHQDELNAILDVIGDKEGIEAADAVLRYLNLSVEVEGAGNIPAEGRFVFVSNHPLGGLDGIALISYFGKRYDGEIRFLVNDLLMAVKPLRSVFLPVNKYGRQSREGATLIEAEYGGERQMLSFPAGLCSRRLAGGVIGDLPWQKSIVTMAVHSRRDVVPMHFKAVNSKRFYRLARLRERLGIKFNFEMILLPGEMLKMRGATLRVAIGAPVAWQSLDAKAARDEAARLREMVYRL